MRVGLTDSILIRQVVCLYAVCSVASLVQSFFVAFFKGLLASSVPIGVQLKIVGFAVLFVFICDSLTELACSEHIHKRLPCLVRNNKVDGPI